MSDHALNSVSSLAGIDFPAGHHTLYHLLKLSQQNGTSPADLIQAIELDGLLVAVFASVSSSQNPSEWHFNFNVQQMQQTLLSVSNRYLSREHSPLAEQHQTEFWRQSVIRASLCASLAASIGLEEKNFELLGLMASLGEQLQLAALDDDILSLLEDEQDAEQSADLLLSAAGGIRPEVYGAELMSGWGLKVEFVDAISYQHAGLDELLDASVAVRILALANHLMSHKAREDFAPALLSLADDLFKLDAAALQLIIDQAGRRLLEVDEIFAMGNVPGTASKNSKVEFQRCVAETNLAALMNLETDSGSTTAKLIFGIESSLRLAPVGADLVLELPSKEQIKISNTSSKSLIAQCYQTQQVITAERESLASIVDRQLSDRLGASGILLLPLGEHGVMVCSRPANSDAYLLEHYRRALIAAFDLAARNDVPMLSVDLVQQKVSEVTHEVNNPLAIVQNYLRTLSLKLEEDNPVQADIDTISREMMRVAGIVQKYADIGQLQTAELQMVNINEIIESLVSVFQGGNSDINFYLDLDSQMQATALIPDSIKQVLVNLLKNALEALRASKQDKGLIKIVSHAGVNLGGRQYLQIMVEDNGPGIKAEIRDKLFLPNNSSKQGHAGLGLSIVKQLLTDMDAMISCRSRTSKESNAGTHFQILIPAFSLGSDER